MLEPGQSELKYGTSNPIKPGIVAKDVPINLLMGAIREVSPFVREAGSSGVWMDFRESSLTLRAANKYGSVRSKIENIIDVEQIFTSHLADPEQLLALDFERAGSLDMVYESDGPESLRELTLIPEHEPGFVIGESLTPPIEVMGCTIPHYTDFIPFERAKLLKILSLLEGGPLTIDQIQEGYKSEKVKFAQRDPETDLPLEVMIGVDRIYRPNVYTGAVPVTLDASLLKQIIKATDYRNLIFHFKSVPSAPFKISQFEERTRSVNYSLRNLAR